MTQGRKRATGAESQPQSRDILIDDRTGSRQLIEFPPLDKMASLTRMEFGDVAFTGNGPDGDIVSIGIEVKSITDLVGSLDTGRLQATQIPGMLRTYTESWLLIHGSYGPGDTPGPGCQFPPLMVRRGMRWEPWTLGKRTFPYSYPAKFLHTLSQCGVKLWRVKDDAEAAVWIATLAAWWSEPWSEHTSMRVLDRSQKRGRSSGGSNSGTRRASIMQTFDDKTMRRIEFASALPGLGYERAVAAARHFQSPRAMTVATSRQWQEVPGIGKGLAKSIVDFFA